MKLILVLSLFYEETGSERESCPRSHSEEDSVAISDGLGARWGMQMLEVPTWRAVGNSGELGCKASLVFHTHIE